MSKRPLFIVAIFFISGIVLARYLSGFIQFIPIFICTLIFILSSFVLTLSQIGREEGEGGGKLANILLLLSIVSFAGLLYVNSNIFPRNHISHFLEEEPLEASLVGFIKSPVLTRKAYFGKISSRYIFEIEAVKNDGGWLEVKGLTHIRIQTEKDYEYGDRLLVRGTIKRPLTQTLSPSGRKSFNYREYLERQNVFAIINTKENSVTVLSHNYKSNPILKYIYSVREKLKNQIVEKMPLTSGAFLRAILLGDRSELPGHIQTAFKRSGTVHILAISGLHVGFIALVIMYLLRFLRIGRPLTYAFIILFFIFFALFTLSRPSVVRAVVMLCFFIIGRLLGRRADVYNSLGIAALFILARNPKDTFNIGFQLSFLAVLSILYLVPKFMKILKEDINLYLRKYLYIPLMVSMAAWLGTFPLILHYFRIITPVAIIASLFIIPALFILLIGGLGFLLLGCIPFVGTFLAGFNNFFAHIIFSLADFFASLRFGHFYL